MATKELPTPPSSNVLNQVAFNNLRLVQDWDPAQAEDIGYGNPVPHDLPVTPNSIPDDNLSDSAAGIARVALPPYHLTDPDLDADWQEQRLESFRKRQEAASSHHNRPSSREQNRNERQNTARARQHRWA